MNCTRNWGTGFLEILNRKQEIVFYLFYIGIFTDEGGNELSRKGSRDRQDVGIGGPRLLGIPRSTLSGEPRKPSRSPVPSLRKKPQPVFHPSFRFHFLSF